MEKYRVRASALVGYRETTLEVGGNPDAFLDAVGLLGAESDPEAWISYHALLHLMNNTARDTNCAHFGLLLAEKQDIGILGPVGFIVQQAPNVRTALQELSSYFGQHNQGAVVSTAVKDGVTHWSFTSKPNVGAPMYQQSDLVAVLARKIMTLLCPGWKPSAVFLAHPPPVDARPYREHFDCPVYYGWDSTLITSDASVLDRPLREANPQLHQLLLSHLDEIQLQFQSDFPGQVSYLIKQALLTGDCSVEKVADVLAMNKRTLQRRLNGANSSYKQLLEDVRFDIAEDYLRHTESSLTSLAQVLCYAELSAFSSAFRVRYGCSPSEWRRHRLG